MMITAKFVSAFSKFVFKCAKCNKPIVCDRKRFEENPATIECYKCKCTHKIVGYKVRKYGLQLDVI